MAFQAGRKEKHGFVVYSLQPEAYSLMSVRYWGEPISPVVWRVYFESDLPDPTFYVWVDGRLLGSTSDSSMEVPVGIGQIAQVEVFDDANGAPEAVYPATVTLRWEFGSAMALARVEQWDGAAWVVLDQVPDTGSGVGRWESAPLADGELHTFRVVPVDGSGRDGIAREFSGVMCRWPDAPSVTVSVVAGEFLIEDV